MALQLVDNICEDWLPSEWDGGSWGCGGSGDEED